MAIDLAAVAKGLSDQIAAEISTLHCYWWPLPKYAFPAAIVAPGVGDEFVTYHESFGSNAVCQAHFTVTLQVSAVSPESAVTTMYAFLSAGTGQTSSVFDAIESDRTFGGTVKSSWCELATAPAWVESPADGTSVLSATLHVHCAEHRG